MTSPAGRRFGRELVKVELATVLSNPFSRPVGWALLLGALPVSVTVWPWLTSLPSAVIGVLGYLIALLTVSVAYLLVAPGIEARAFDAAPHRWLEQYPDGRAGAFARPDRQGRLTLFSVWAEPRDRGLGSRLMSQILDDTADAGDLWLVAVNQRAAAFYQRHGFRHVKRDLLGHRMLLDRPPVSAPDDPQQQAGGTRPADHDAQPARPSATAPEDPKHARGVEMPPADDHQCGQ